MNELKIFENPEFGRIRTVRESGNILFCGSDVAKALGYNNARKALNNHCKGVTNRDTPTKGGIQTMLFIPEGDVYRLIVRSQLPAAEKFESWVFDEVLPAIRRTGSYAVPDRFREHLAEAKLNNSRARLAASWFKLADRAASEEFKQVCTSYASKVLTGGTSLIPLPSSEEHFYTATEVGQMLGGVTSQRIGLISNQHGLKTAEYGRFFFDKSRYSNKEVQAFRYNENGVRRLSELLKA